jgi:predicted RNA-binding Zn-ribbon protein involved in translation (DUF1610 family)
VIFTALAGILFFWLLGFVVDDIGEMKGPQLADVEKSVLDPALVSQDETITRKLATLATEIEGLKARQTLLRDSTTSSQATMNQLLDVRKQDVEKRVSPSAAEQNALAQSESLFLANQEHYQALNEEISRKSDQQRSLEQEKAGVESGLSVQREAAARRFASLDQAHHLRVAAFQLLFLIPILLLAGYVLLKWRKTIYAPLIYALGAATLAKVVLVIHEHFPTRYFKYILLLAALVIVIRALVYLIRATVHPKAEALLKQYREAYERFLCPICEYPIRRGPMKFSYWTRRSIRKLPPSGAAAAVADEPYTCPSCGSRLFEACMNCHAVRSSLLPFCEHCGQATTAP